MAVIDKKNQQLIWQSYCH